MKKRRSSRTSPLALHLTFMKRFTYNLILQYKRRCYEKQLIAKAEEFLSKTSTIEHTLVKLQAYSVQTKTLR